MSKWVRAYDITLCAILGRDVSGLNIRYFVNGHPAVILNLET